MRTRCWRPATLFLAPAALLVPFTVAACARLLPPPARPSSSNAVVLSTLATEPQQVESEASGGPPKASVPDEEPTIEPTLQAGELELSTAIEVSVPLSLPAKIRVGLASDLPSVTLSCCAKGLVASAGGRNIAILRGLTVEPGVEVSKPPIYRLQIAALRDEGQAAQLAKRYSRQLGDTADLLFDAADGFYRVRWGRYSTREEAEDARSRLAQLGIHEAWIVSEQPDLEAPSLTVIRGDQGWVVPGRWLELRSASEDGLPYGDKRYRGVLLVYLNDRGKLNLINLVSLDDYLRGVVPREMGPEVYDNLEALKAQAVAARTYTVRNLGEFGSEGFDICATPRCQVYGGMAAEHPLSDRAVLETSGVVAVFEGAIAEALYSSTCGGHTENVEIVFPEKRHAYLRGVPCLEAGVDRLAGSAPADASLEASVVDRLLRIVLHASPPLDFGQRLVHLALGAGLRPPAVELVAFDRRSVQRFVARMLDLEIEAELFVAQEDLSYLLGPPPADWDLTDLKLAALLSQKKFLQGRLDQPPTSVELERALFQVALFLRQVEQLDVRYLKMIDDQLVTRSQGVEQAWVIPPELPTFRRASGTTQVTALRLVPGDRLELYVLGTELLAIRQEVDPDGVSFDRTSNLRSWSRFRSDTELAKRVAERYPGLLFQDLALLDRGVSGRVRTMSLVGQNGDSVEVRGLPIRWTLDLPDTLFTAKRLKPLGGKAGWLFSGRGWGHGVGLCQVGAYGMALRGHPYSEILRHYYSGIELQTIPTATDSVSATP